MATQRWDDNRLDKLADMVEVNRILIDANSRNIGANTQAISQLISAMRKQQESNTEIFQAIVQEIKGLRAENRRILTHLFGEQQSE